MYLLIIFLPLIGSLIAGLLGRYIGKQGAIILTTSLVGLSSLLSFIVFYAVVFCLSVCTINLFCCIESNNLSII